MFINCPYCRALVATDPVTDLPPTHCPDCMSLLRRDATIEDDADEPTSADLGDLLEARVDETAHDSPATDPVVAFTITEEIATDMTSTEDAFAATGDNDGEHGENVAIAAPAMTAAASVAPAKGGLRAAPSFVRGVAVSASPRERWAPALAAALALLLALQLLLADRARLAADAQWRPLLSAVCNMLFCDLPPWREPAAFALLQRDVRQHPSIPGALRVSATFRNDARWPQPWPQLQLTLSDANGRPAGERRFGVDDYLGGPPSQPELASGESATVAMDILEPAAQIVAYDFKFR